MPLRLAMGSSRARSGGASSGGGSTRSLAGSPTSCRKPSPSGPPALEDRPVLVTDRDVGSRDPTRAAGRDGQPCRRSRFYDQGRPPDAHHTSSGGHKGDPLRSRRDDVTSRIEVAARGSARVERGDLAPFVLA
jgi:hypothetical protein